MQIFNGQALKRHVVSERLQRRGVPALQGDRKVQSREAETRQLFASG